MIQIKNTLCRMCDDRCAMQISMADGQITDVAGVKGHPWNNGKLCIKGKAVQEFVFAADRILKPLKRVGQGWQEIPLDSALDEIADQIASIIKRYGARSVAVWKGEGVGFQQQEGLTRRFAHALGTPNYLSSDSACFSSRYIASTLVYGAMLIPDFENAACISIWGANPINTHPFAFEKINQAKRNGAKIIVIDPRKSETAKLADLHVAIKPGTDGVLAWGIIRCLIENNALDDKFIEGYTIGFEEVKSYALHTWPDLVQSETGLDWETVQQIADWLVNAKPRSICYVGNGLELNDNGAENARAIALLPALLGCIDTLGGNRIGGKPPIRDLTLYEEKPLEHFQPIGADTYPVLYDKRKECHTMSAVDAMLSGKPYPIKALLLTAGNPLLSNPNSGMVRKAFQNLELLVVRDLFMTQTAKMAHYVLPAASFLERSELHVNDSYNIINTTEKLFEMPSCQDEYSFWRSLAQRLDAGHYFPWESETDLNRWLLEGSGVSLEELSASPRGFVFEPLRYEKWREAPFSTESGKIELASDYMGRMGYQRVPVYQKPAYLAKQSPEFPLCMISGSKRKLYNHSRYHNMASFKKMDPQPFAGMHETDAHKLGIENNDLVRVSSRFGSISLHAEILKNDAILPGFILVPDGWEEPNVNVLTSDELFDPVSGFPALKSQPVRVEKI